MELAAAELGTIQHLLSDLPPATRTELQTVYIYQRRLYLRLHNSIDAVAAACWHVLPDGIPALEAMSDRVLEEWHAILDACIDELEDDRFACIPR